MNLAWIEVHFNNVSQVKAFGKFNGQLWQFVQIADVDDCHIKAYYTPLCGVNLELIKVATNETDPKHKMGKQHDLEPFLGGKVSKSGDGDVIEFWKENYALA